MQAKQNGGKEERERGEKAGFPESGLKCWKNARVRRRRWIDLQNKTGCVKNRNHFFVHGSHIISTSSPGMSCKLLLLVWSVGNRAAPLYFKAVYQAFVCASQVYIREKYISTRPRRLFDVAFSSSYHIVHVRSSIGWIIQYDRIDRITSPITCPHCLAHLTAL